MTKESILKRKRTDIVISETLFSVFEDDTLWVCFFQIRSYCTHPIFVSYATPSNHYGSIPFTQVTIASTTK